MPLHAGAYSPPGVSSLARVRRAVLRWYAGQARDLPWRRTRDPYAVLVSEVMLQQTQAGRVAGRFERFMASFPTVEALAAAPPAAVLAEWSGLGYNRRAPALQRTAREVALHGWPNDVAGLHRLPGVGPYTARAVASLAFGEAAGAVDTNVRRWLLRRFGTPGSAAGLQALADGLARQARSPDEAATWTHASMELGAVVCLARRPRCGACPIAAACPSRDRAAHVPVRRQPPFGGSMRQRRGGLIRALSNAPGHELPMASARTAIGAHGFDRIVAGLERDGLVSRAGGVLRLGQAGRG